MLVSLEISNRDPGYGWFLSWMATAQRQETGLAARWSRSPQLSLHTTVQQTREHAAPDIAFSMVAGLGNHYLRYRGAWFQVHREREVRSAAASQGPVWETVTLTTLARDRELFKTLLAEARTLAVGSLEGKLIIRTPYGLEWRPFGLPRAKRPLSSVVLDTGISERIQADLSSFIERKSWYADRGIPYRRGYLLHGPPGSGKSSFIRALAGAFNYEICVLNLAERGLTDDRLNVILSNIPERSILLMEDVDAAFNKRVQVTADGYQSSVTFSGFLNALDGVASGEERMLFLTTNHIERLDPALIRPGRVDVVEYLGDTSSAQARRYFEQFFGENAAGADELEKAVSTRAHAGRRTSMAALQGHFIRHSLPRALDPTVLDEIFTTSARGSDE
ncbi:P-loop containing nucleoside triphosphate hydrolase protein [Exidia glandulosa HHB12029]|uniref:p-loop containing nucleoside triphosphate hydrolase protein n=1 Tax=Exidia glandulosa HHB12029 TaxID=1314781 RepID=A0A165J8W1_EXIGL|nr:P-loop containing nucleoside triphosphate hydrolase protein [Exidia glandulosa HHB12029]